MEVVISAVLVVLIAVGVLGGLDSAGRASAEERHRAQAHALAQADQARMRAMSISDLSGFAQVRTVVDDGARYTIDSGTQYVSDETGTSSCEPGVASADYIQITSTVTWATMDTRPPVVSKSIIAPPNSSVTANSGALALSVVDSESNGIAGITISGTGPKNFSAVTGPTGCIIVGNLPAGNYSVTPSVGSRVNKDGLGSQATTTSVTAQSTNTVVLQYDQPGSIPVTFTTRVSGSLVASAANGIVAFHTGMTVARTFGPGLGATPVSQITATPLFPFTSPYTVYAGSCVGNNPDPAGTRDPAILPALADVIVPRGGSAAAVVQLPALHLTVYSGTGAASPGAPQPSPVVRIRSETCPSAPWRTLPTNALGQLQNPGLPWGSYSVCAQNVNGNRRHLVTGVSVRDLTAGTAMALYTNNTLDRNPCP